MHYVLMFPKGDLGWYPDMQSLGTKEKVTLMEYFQYRFQTRPGDSDLFRFGKLFQQYAVDAYCRIEAGRLRWVRMNQKTIRAEVYSGLQDAIANDLNLAKIGKRVILPSSVSGSPRHQHQLYSDAMAVVRDLGKPSFL